VHTIDRSPAARGSIRGFHRWFLCAAVGGVALLAAGWSAPGLAAAHPSAGCDKLTRSLQGLDIDRLAIEVVDLSDVSESPEASDDLTESVAPLLFLTPRVATILEHVFGDSEEALAEVRVETAPANADKREPATPPVVDNAGAPDIDAPVSPLYENAAILPRFQRQMYRTDI
jgi:hypothetical protein